MTWIYYCQDCGAPVVGPPALPGLSQVVTPVKPVMIRPHGARCLTLPRLRYCQRGNVTPPFPRP